MSEEKLTYNARKEYLKADKEIRNRWESLVSLWENIKNNLKQTLASLPKTEATRRRKELTAKNIFNIINTAKQRPNFKRERKMIWNEDDQRYEYVIQCLNPSSDYIFRKIKEERWVTNMHWQSINKYLQPITDKIWALKAAVQASIQPETNTSELSYDILKTNVSDWENHEVDPDYPKAKEWWRDPVQPWSESPLSQEENTEDNHQKGEKNEKKWKNFPDKNEYRQLLIQFPDFDN